MWKRFILETMRGRPGPASALLRLFLRALSLAYGGGVRVRNAAFNAGWLPARPAQAPVISVGNLTAGGTGKTPAVEYVSERLAARGRKPAVVCRGYGADAGGGWADEQAMLRERWHVVADRDRGAAARRALAEGADCIVLDDGFQHRRLQRDLDILLLDALDPFGGGRLLPAGFLREPPASARRADAVVLTRADLAGADALDRLAADAARLCPGAPVFRARHAPATLAGDLAGPAETLAGTPAFLFSGVGNPDGFRGTAESLGVRVLGEQRFPDHHAYAPADLKDVARRAEKTGAKLLLTTSKDWVKVRTFPRGAVPLSALEVRFELIDGTEEMDRLLDAALERGDRRRESGPGAVPDR